jgi:hypothetical protein
MNEVERYFSRLSTEGFINSENLSGCTEEDVLSLAEIQEVDTVPAVYREFLRLAGRDSGGLLRGSNHTLDDLRKIKGDARELLVEDGQPTGILDGALVFLMHQGYVFYYFEGPSLGEPDPPVMIYEEAEGPPRRAAASFTEYLGMVEESLRKIRRRRHESSF